MKPYVPSAYGSIAKIRVPSHLLDSLAWDLQKWLSERGNTEAAAPNWAVVERSPEVGARKRRCRQVASLVNGLEMDLGTGHVYYKALQLGRLSKRGNDWDMEKHRHAINDEMWEKLRAAARAEA